MSKQQTANSKQQTANNNPTINSRRLATIVILFCWVVITDLKAQIDYIDEGPPPPNPCSSECGTIVGAGPDYQYPLPNSTLSSPANLMYVYALPCNGNQPTTGCFNFSFAITNPSGAGSPVIGYDLILDRTHSCLQTGPTGTPPVVTAIDAVNQTYDFDPNSSHPNLISYTFQQSQFIQPCQTIWTCLRLCVYQPDGPCPMAAPLVFRFRLRRANGTICGDIPFVVTMSCKPATEISPTPPDFSQSTVPFVPSIMTPIGGGL